MTLLIQWNCQGIHAKREKLQHLIASVNQVCTCLQFITRESNKLSLQKHQSHVHLGTFDTGPPGGVTVIVHQDIPQEPGPLQSALQVKAVRTELLFPCSFLQMIRTAGLESVTEKLPSHSLLIGDYSGHHLHCGDTTVLVSGARSPQYCSSTMVQYIKKKMS